MVKKLRAVRIKDRDLEELKKLSKKEGETVSFLIQQAIREFLKRRSANAQ
jgi:predicted DNA-binding protein